MSWVDNAAMFWSLDGTTWNKVSDHNRDVISMSVERIETKNRMANGTMRKYTVAKKRTWSTTWNNIPSRNDIPNSFTTADGGFAGRDIENWHNTVDGPFYLMLRTGQDKNTDNSDIDDGQIFTVMISDFSKDVNKRGTIDLWNISISLEEV